MGRGELNKSPGAYLGVTATTPPNMVVADRPPTTKDYRNFSIGDYWLDQPNEDLYIIVSKAGTTSQQEGTWIPLVSGSGNVVDFQTDDGNIVVPIGGKVFVFGGSNMNTTGAIANTITINLNNFIVWPATNAAGDEGVIYIDGESVLHTYDAVNSPSHNLFVGEAAGNFTLTTAQRNSGLGTLNLASITTATDNFAGGYNVLPLLQDGIRNVGISSNALGNAISSEDCIAIGTNALLGATVETKSIAIGTNASAQGGGFNIAIGTNAMFLNNNPVGRNVALGNDVMIANIDSEQTVALGASVLQASTTGDANTAVGFGSLGLLQSGTFNSAFGVGSGQSYTGSESFNVVIGSEGVAGESNAIRIGGFNQVLGGPIAIGAGALPFTSDTNIAIGAESLNLLNGVTGFDNLAIGIRSLRHLDNGFRNLSIGHESSINYVGGENSNIIIGNEGLIGDSNTIRIGTDGNGTGEQNATYIAGIYTSPGLINPKNVVIQADGRLGVGDAGDGSTNAFFAYLPSNETIVGQLVDVDYALGATLALTEVFDDGGNFFPGDGAGTAAFYTAPADGKYIFNWYFQANRSTGIGTVQVNTIGIVPSLGNAIKGTGSAAGAGPSGVFPALFSLSAGETVEFHYIQSPDTGNDTTVFGGITDIRPGFYPSYTTWVSGYQVTEIASPTPVTADAFMAVQEGAAVGVTGDGTVYELGSAAVLTTVYDDGSNFYPGDGVGAPAVFTASTSGKYNLSMNIHASISGSPQPRLYEVPLSIVTTARTYNSGTSTASAFITTASQYRHAYSLSVLADMQAGDTATFNFNIGGFSAGDGSLAGAAVTSPITWVSGYKVSN